MKRFPIAPVVLLAAVGCMEGTKPNPLPRSPKTLYQRLGSAAGVKKIVDDFVGAVMESDRIREAHKKHFREGDVESLKKKLRDQFGEEAGGPEKYTGKNMKEGHKGLGITEADFAALVDALVKSLDKNRVSPDDQKELITKLARFKDDVIEKPDELKGVLQKKDD